MSAVRTRVLALLGGLALSLGVLTAAPASAAPLDDPFFDYTGTTPLAQVKPGTVLKTRTVSYAIQGVPLPLKAIQLLYRTSDQLGRPTVNATTVVRPLLPLGAPKVLSYQSFYDSLDPADQPSAVIAGGTGLGAGIVNVETLLFAPALLAGYTINIPDTEGQDANFAAGPEYGVNTLDSLRAISNSTATGVGKTSKIGLIGYSGGAIASEWAAELAATKAPDVASRIVGTAVGGVLVSPGRNLRYVEGSTIWSGVIPMALVGIGRSFDIDLSVYANDYGKKVMADLDKASITDALGRYPGLTWAKLTKPQYAVPESVPAFIDVANTLIMSTGGTPSSPMFIGQGTAGQLELTAANKPGIGKGDGVMIAGDVRTLAKEYCARGVKVVHKEYPLSHLGATATWLPQAYSWLLQRFAGRAAPDNCATIPAGNAAALAPLVALK